MASRPYLWSLVTLLALWCVAPLSSYAASLSLAPQSGTYTVGSTFTVSVIVSSTESLNAISGVVSYPKDKLAVTGISKAGSILNLWVQEPSFSNSDGVASFEGVVLNTGYSGSGGKAVTLTFSVIAPGEASVSFSSGMALANDGEGSDILEDLRSARYTLQASAPVEAIEPSTEEVAPRVGAAPVIVSSTHRDQESWYSVRTASFAWKNPEGVTATRLLIDEEPLSTPNVVYSEALESKEVRDLEDGVWYFHAETKVGGSWSESGHYKVQIDTISPTSASITEIARTDATDPVARFALSAADDGSGIESFAVLIDGGPEVVVPYVADATFATSPLTAGVHIATLIARDRAGNETKAEASFTIAPIIAPSITKYPSRLLAGDALMISGDAMDGVVYVTLEGEGVSETYTAEARSGAFTLMATPELKKGIYRLSAHSVDLRGATSPKSEIVVMSVEGGAFIRWGTFTVSVLSVIVPLVGLVALLGLTLVFAWHKFIHLRHVQAREIKEAQAVVHKAFALFREDINTHIEALEKARKRRILTREEKKLLKQLTKNAQEAEAVILKEIGDIEKVK